MLEREIRQKFERIMAEVEWGKVLSTLNDMLGDTLTPAQTVQPVPLYSEAGASSQEQVRD